MSLVSTLILNGWISCIRCDSDNVTVFTDTNENNLSHELKVGCSDCGRVRKCQVGMGKHAKYKILRDENLLTCPECDSKPLISENIRSETELNSICKVVEFECTECGMTDSFNDVK